MYFFFKRLYFSFLEITSEFFISFISLFIMFMSFSSFLNIWGTFILSLSMLIPSSIHFQVCFYWLIFLLILSHIFYFAWLLLWFVHLFLGVLLYWENFLLLVLWKFLLGMDVGFCQMHFLHLLKWLYCFPILIC